MQPGGRKTDEDVAFANRFTFDELRFVDDADDEAGDVVVVIAVEAGHLGGLAADQRAAIFLARARHSADDVRHDFRPQTAGRVVIEKKKRTRSLHQDVVDAVAHQVVADGVVNLHRLRDTQLRADTVSRRNKNRRLHSAEIRAKESAEQANVRHDVGRKRAARDVPNLTEGLILGVDVYARVAIRRLVGHGARV